MGSMIPRDMERRWDDKIDRAERAYRDLATSDHGRAAMQRLRRRGGGGVKAKAVKIVAILLASFAGFIVIGNILGGIGIVNFMLLIMAVAVSVGAVAFWPKREEKPVTQEEIVNAELGALPVRVEKWLTARRDDLPLAAQRQCDELLLRLEVLSAQLKKVAPDAPVVSDARKLIGEELPRLVESYLNVPESHRSTGSEPEAQLIEGLDTVSTELKRLSDQLARGDLDRLAIEGRFLEIKYREGEAGKSSAEDPATS